jgi:aminopeptidase N
MSERQRAMEQSTPNDVYVPDHGDPTFGVSHYDLVLSVALENNALSGRATLTIEATEDLDRLELDLFALRVSRVKVDGAQPAKWSQRRHRLVLRLREPLAAGTQAAVEVTYAGSPRPMPGPDGEAGWEELEDGLIVASQPHGAPSWFPCNDRPDDKATYRLEITAPNDYTVVANGRAGDKRRRGSTTTWEYVADAPMATYLATLQVGRYVPITDTAGAVEVTTWCPPARRESVIEAFADQTTMVERFAELFGPYPFDTYAAVVTDDELEIPLEAQTLSIFGSNLATRDWSAQRLVAHELAHQWFGNSLTLRHWRDIWLHEGFACYAEWLWSELSGGPDADAHAREQHERLAGLEQDLLLGDPGPDDLFDDRVYKRGALTLHTLRRTLGDDLFFDVLRSWTAAHRHGTVTTEQLLDHVSEATGVDAAALLGPWLTERALPDLPA